MRRAATPLLLILLPLAVFLAWFHAATLDIGNPGWLIRGTDNGENALGLHAYRHDPAAGASLRIKTLNAPDGVPVLYLDSNPLVTLTAKLFSPLLPADAQLVGPWVLLCLILSALFAWLLLRAHAPGALALWVGVILLAFPPTLGNRFIHTNLMAHWTILAALWLYLDPRRRTSLAWWAGLIAVTALIHSYLLIMVGAIWASAQLARLVVGPARERAVAVGDSAAILLLVAVLAYWLGAFGDYARAGNFGTYAMPLNALWNPGRERFSWFLPGSAPNPGRAFEGFQYLGAGGLLLLIGASGVVWRRPAREGERAVARRLLWLTPTLIVLTILAVVSFPLPHVVQSALDPVRASGRLFWPVGYVLVLAAVLAWYRLSPERAGLALVGLLVVQIVDLSGMANWVRKQSGEAGEHRLYARTTGPRWDEWIAQSQSIAFMPGDVTKVLGVFQEVAWRAAKAGRPVNAVYAARWSRATIKRLEREEAAFNRGELVPGRMYVLAPGAMPPPGTLLRSHTIDGVTVIPASPSPSPSPSSPR